MEIRNLIVGKKRSNKFLVIYRRLQKGKKIFIQSVYFIDIRFYGYGYMLVNATRPKSKNLETYSKEYLRTFSLLFKIMPIQNLVDVL